MERYGRPRSPGISSVGSACCEASVVFPEVWLPPWLHRVWIPGETRRLERNPYPEIMKLLLDQQAGVFAVRIAIAATRVRLHKTKPADSLAEITAALPDLKLPLDPWSDQPFSYRPAAGAGITITSTGRDPTGPDDDIVMQIPPPR
jgi:hypothetical protein